MGDRDLCLLNTMRYESEASSGSSCVGGIFNSDDGTCVPLPPYALRSGPRDTIYWNPKDVRRSDLSPLLPAARLLEQGTSADGHALHAPSERRRVHPSIDAAAASSDVEVVVLRSVPLTMSAWKQRICI